MSRMPALFVGHGSPMNAIEENEFSRAWAEVGKILPRPKGIVCISAHWETDGAEVTAMAWPRTIHDFYGFPPELQTAEYPAPGSPELAERVRQVVKGREVKSDLGWGLDHGCWSVLKPMYPQADIPVVQFSLQAGEGMRAHYELGRELKALREEGILLLGSGNIVHNLRMVQWGEMAYDWATEYDTRVGEWILADEHEEIIEYEKYGQAGLLAVNSGEHYKPLVSILAVKEEVEEVRFFAEKVMMGSISMRSVQIG